MTSGGAAVGAWGPGSAVQIGPRAYALFVSDGRDRPYMEVRLVAAAAPGRVSGSVRRYEWETVRPAAVLKDAERNLWLLYLSQC